MVSFILRNFAGLCICCSVVLGVFLHCRGDISIMILDDTRVNTILWRITIIISIIQLNVYIFVLLASQVMHVPAKNSRRNKKSETKDKTVWFKISEFNKLFQPQAVDKSISTPFDTISTSQLKSSDRVEISVRFPMISNIYYFSNVGLRTINITQQRVSLPRPFNSKCLQTMINNTRFSSWLTFIHCYSWLI